MILDADLASLYGVTTRRLKEQVRRNPGRFPADFAFPLTAAEKSEVVAICDHLHNLRFSKGLPLAFTEHGAIMAASVLNSDRAVAMSVHVVRAFLRLREMLASHRGLAEKLTELERRVGDHDESLRSLVEALRGLLDPRPVPDQPRIGFKPEWRRDCADSHHFFPSASAATSARSWSGSASGVKKGIQVSEAWRSAFDGPLRT